MTNKQAEWEIARDKAAEGYNDRIVPSIYEGLLGKNGDKSYRIVEKAAYLHAWNAAREYFEKEKAIAILELTEQLNAAKRARDQVEMRLSNIAVAYPPNPEQRESIQVHVAYTQLQRVIDENAELKRSQAAEMRKRLGEK